MNRPTRTIVHHYRPSPLLRWLPVAALLCLLAFALVALAAAVFQGVRWGWWTALILLALAAYFALNFWQMAYTVTLREDHLTLHRFGRDRDLPYDDITGANLAPNALTLRTGEGKLSLYGEPNALSELRALLEERAPALARQRDARRSRPLPIYWRKEALSYLSPFLLMLFSLILIASLAWAWLGDPFSPGLQNPLLTLAFAFAAGLTMIIAVGMLRSLVYRVTFEEATISLHYLGRVQSYAVEDLRDIRLQAEERAVRGIPRTFYTLQLLFEGQVRPVEIGPSFSDSLGIRQEQARRQLADLRQALLRHYPLVRQIPGQGVHLGHNEWGRAVLKRCFLFKPADLEVQEEDYGEHHNGAWAIHFTFSRPMVEGITRFRTSNGELRHSDDGRFLLLHDFTQLVLLDLARADAYHYRLERGRQFRRVSLEGGRLLRQCLTMTRPPRTIVLDPVPLTREDLGRALAPGTGTYPPGDFPSAWPTRAPGSPPPPGAPSPAQAVADVLGYARSLGSRLPEAFEDLRDTLNDLGLEAMPRILEAARSGDDGVLLELLVIVLVDNAYPPAYPDFVHWLDHPRDEIRFFCSSALDVLAGGAFGISQMSSGGFVQHERIRDAIPRIKAWWQREGKQRLPTLSAWRREREARRPIGKLEKWFNFLELNPLWIKFGDGTVARQERGFRLPRRQGIHVVGGQVWLSPASESVFGAFVMDSDLGRVRDVYIREDGRWVDVGRRMVRAEPNFEF